LAAGAFFADRVERAGAEAEVADFFVRVVEPVPLLAVPFVFLAEVFDLVLGFDVLVAMLEFSKCVCERRS